jgi:hypothetical protein
MIQVAMFRSRDKYAPLATGVVANMDTLSLALMSSGLKRTLAQRSHGRTGTWVAVNVSVTVGVNVLVGEIENVGVAVEVGDCTGLFVQVGVAVCDPTSVGLGVLDGVNVGVAV